YPMFTLATCGWHTIFECIAQPSNPFSCGIARGGPGSLGKYPNVLSLCKSWDKGGRIEGVEQQLPLRLVVGLPHGHALKEEHLPANSFLSHQAQRKWSQYQFFTRHIEESMANGKTALRAIHELEGLCSP
ncbi:hypothetical protein EDB84DRAFT_1265770, partial [Lactarius hengduanensis]